MPYLSKANPKTAKGEKLGVLTAIMHFAPASLSGTEVCPSASAGCRAACLNTAGRGRMQNIQDARVRKTRRFFEDRAAALTEIAGEIAKLERKANRDGMRAAVRLNGTSDLPWEKFRVTYQGREYRNLMEAFPNVQFYDYTKIMARALKHATGGMPANYHLTFSAAEDNDNAVRMVLANGGSVAMVFDNVPAVYMGYRVIDGDESDVRFNDPAGVIVGLKAKGDAKHDATGFVRRIADLKRAA